MASPASSLKPTVEVAGSGLFGNPADQAAKAAQNAKEAAEEAAKKAQEAYDLVVPAEINWCSILCCSLGNSLQVTTCLL
jgi:hypothetical protein